MLRKKINDLIIEKINGEWGQDPIGDEGVKVLRTTNFTKYGKIDYSDMVYRKIPDVVVKRKRLLLGDIIIEKSGGSTNRPVGRVVIFDNKDETILNNNFTTALRINQSIVFPLYLYFNLRHLHQSGKTLKYQNKTTGILNLKLDEYLKEVILLPSISDQIRISTLLTRIDALMAKRRESLLLLDKLVENRFWEMFGDIIQDKKYQKPLNKVAKIDSGLTKGKNYEGKETVIIPYLRVANVQAGYINISQLNEIEAQPSDIQKYSLRKNDLLLTEGGDRDKLGRGALWNHDVPNCIFQNHIFRVRVYNDKIVNPVYLSYLAGSSYGKGYFLKSAKQTTGIASINSTQLGQFPVAIPKLEIQNQFADFVARIESLKAKYTVSLATLEQLYISTSHRAFRGELNMLIDGLEVVKATDWESEITTAKKERDKAFKKLTKSIRSKGLSAQEEVLLKKVEHEFQQRKGQIKSLGGDFLQHIIIKHQLQQPFTFDDFENAIDQYPAELGMFYDDKKKWFFDLLKGENPFLQQILHTTEQEEMDEKGDKYIWEVKRIAFNVNQPTQ